MAYYRDKILLKKFGDNVKRLRLERELSQQALSGSLGFSQTHLANIESGKVNTSVSHAAAIAEKLEVPLSRLFEFSKLTVAGEV